MSNVLAKTPQDVEQVTIEPDGKWSQLSEPDVTINPSSDHAISGDDDELIEIKDMPRVATTPNESSHLPSRSPHSSSSEQSATSQIASTGSGKRPYVIIDISSDEEGEEQERASKRQNTVPGACPSFHILKPGRF